MHFHKPIIIALLFILSAGRSYATHFYGVDLFYTHVSGNTYRVSLVAFGDCSGAQFPSFSVLRPRIYVIKGNTDTLTDFLNLEPPKNGIEVTPVCPAELSNTTCVNPSGTVPGVTKFTYSKEFTLSGPSADWKFVFLGQTDGNAVAGRSVSLTNVNPVGIISLVATLNNTQRANSSPEYTTIATPFYCAGKPTNFNPGAVDADGDSLVYELVPGLDFTSALNYVTGFSGSHPLDVSPGTFSFSSSTGQLSFTPATIQRSLVVYRVSEYHDGILQGTCMREMTVVVMPCNNNAPVGYIANAAGAIITDSITVKTCSGNREVAFDINPSDADGQNISMVANGLPKNARLDITNNNTKQPKSRFVWSVPDLPDGDYTFFVTYTDDGCPIASRQTQAYTVRIAHQRIFVEAVSSGCATQGLIKVGTSSEWLPWDLNISEDLASVYSKKGITIGSWTDSIESGKYKIEVVTDFGCNATADVVVPSTCDLADLPNAFSPNGDGNNDMLYVYGKNIQELTLKLYNRWGQLVFETHDQKTGWDGRFNGKDAQVESYAYVLSVVFKSSQTFEKKGNVTLLR